MSIAGNDPNRLVTSRSPTSGSPPTNAIITTVSSVVVAANRNRKYLYLTNIGARDIWIGLGNTVSVDKGILIDKNGGRFSITSDNQCYDAINAIVANATSTLAIHEGE